jgi:hypothetical protein
MSDEIEQLKAERDAARAQAAALAEALDHPLLRELFGTIEDSDGPITVHLWSLAVLWFDVRDTALATYRIGAP